MKTSLDRHTSSNTTNLKFRAWDTVAKKMSPSFSLFGEFLLVGGVHEWQEEGAPGDCLSRLNDLVVMRSTGLVDKKGKEIFEGDILKSCDDSKSGIKFHYVVEWGHHGWTTRHYQSAKRSSLVSNYFFSQSEIIGNIYEDLKPQPEMKETYIFEWDASTSTWLVYQEEWPHVSAIGQTRHEALASLISDINLIKTRVLDKLENN